MKKLLIIFMLLSVCNCALGAYTGTMPKDIGTSTPAGGENPNVIDDVLREDRTVQVNLYKLKFVGTNTTLLANDSWVVGSSTSDMLITMPAASSCANSSVTKPFVITNYGSGTITLNITVDGVGSPTVAGSQTMTLFTDGTLWYEQRSRNAYDSDYLGGVIASGYARSGANSDITSLSGLTTALPISEGGTGQTTAATAASALGVGTEDSPTFTGVNATTGSTTTHTSTTLTATTGNITNVSSTAGTFTGNVQVGSMSGLEDADIPNDITLTNITQITNRSHNDITGTGTYSHTQIDTHIDDTSDPHGASLTQTNATITTGTVTTLHSTTSNITTGNITTGNITTGNITNISGTSGTWTGNINAASASGYDYVSRWRSGSTIGTGTMAIQGSGDIISTPSYSNGAGTITISLSGSASAKPNIDYNAAQIIGNATDIDFTSPLRVVGSGSSVAVISLDNISLGTQTNGTINLSTQVAGLLSLATQTTGMVGLGTQTNGTLDFSRLSGNPTDNGTFSVTGVSGKVAVGSTSGMLDYSWMPQIVRLVPTTEPSAGDYGQWFMGTSSAVANGGDAYTELLLHANNPGTTNFVDSSLNIYGLTVVGNTIGTTTAKFGSGGAYFDGTGDRIEVNGAATFKSLHGADDTSNFKWTIDFWYKSLSFAANQYLFGSEGDSSAQIGVELILTTTRAFSFQIVRGVVGQTVMDVVTDAGEFPNDNNWHFIRVTYDQSLGSSNFNIAVDGTVTHTANKNAYTPSTSDPSAVFRVGQFDAVSACNGVMDEFSIAYGVTRSLTEVPISQYSGGGYIQYNTKYLDTKGIAIISAITTGTATTDPSYIMLNGSTTIFGLGTTTAIAGTTTSYSGWFDGAVRATAFNVASTEKIKENIKPIKISPDLLDAEGIAKNQYIALNKSAWIEANRVNYESVVDETRTGTVTILDRESMEAAYNTYIEFAWAADLEQDTLIDNVKKQFEAGFWQKFDTVKTKSWNPKGLPNITRKGLIVEECPDEIKGDDKQSVDLMAVSAYSINVLQAMKENLVTVFKNQGLIMKALMNGTYTQSEIETSLNEIDRKLEVMGQ